MEESHRATLEVFETLRAGDEVELRHAVKVGFRSWETVTVGKVISAERRRHGLHQQRNHDDKVFSDVIVLERSDGERTTVTLDEYTQLRKLSEEA